MTCKVDKCSLPKHCKGFCRKHSSAHYRGQISNDGSPINYNPRPDYSNGCTFKLCGRKVHGNGLCSLHRKWLYKGWIDSNNKVLVPEKCKERLSKCKMCGSDKVKGYGFCQKHYRDFKRGDITENGSRLFHCNGPMTVLGTPRVRNKGPQSCSVKMCFSKKLISKSLCKKHQGMVKAGLIDKQGNKLRDPMRVRTYRGKKCLICPEQARSKNFCHNHYNHFNKGHIDANGKWLVPQPLKNKGKTCSHDGCIKEAKSNSLCPQHNYWHKTGFVGWKNKGHTCSEYGCNKPAVARTMCHSHYRKFRVIEKLKLNATISFSDTLDLT